MTLLTCPREKEIAQLLALGQWPQAAPAELRAHLAACRSCADLVLVAPAFQSARASAIAAAPSLSPGLLLWRAKLRRRQAAIQRVSRPILGAHLFALCLCLAVAVAFAVTQATHSLNWLSWFDQLSQPTSINLRAFSPAALFDSPPSLLVLIPVLATLALLGGVAVYLASSERQ
jgi:hypothetical protein